MLIAGIFLFFLWIIISIIIAGDMFKLNVCLGCFGLLLLPILPFVWVLTGYTGRKKIMAPLFFGTAILAISLLTYSWMTANESLATFFDQAATEGVHLSLRKVESKHGVRYVTVISEEPIYSNEIQCSDQELLELIRSDKIESLAKMIAELSLKEDETIRIAMLLASDRIAVYDIDSQGRIIWNDIMSSDAL